MSHRVLFACSSILAVVVATGVLLGSRASRPLDVDDVLERAFGDALTMDKPGPAYVVGDFNWDGVQDLAAAARPAQGKLNDINRETASWILEDPRKVPVPDFQAVVTRASRSRIPVESTDTLLAIVHGEGKDGWRTPGASHFYLLKNGAGTDLRVVSRQQFYDATRNSPRKVQTVRGDVIAQTFGPKRGYIMFAGGKYAWYDPQLPSADTP